MKNKIAILLLLFFSIDILYGTKVKFTYKSPGAKKVSIAGEFNSWDRNANPMKREGDKWVIEIDLPPGEYEYKFVIDGKKWVADPNAEKFVPDGFGGKNSVVIVKPEKKPGEKPPYEFVNFTGSFNNWNQADPNYVMDYIGDGVYEIIKLFYPGVYKFKFNMNKTWNENLGAGKGGKLEPNGPDLQFSVDEPAYFRITVDVYRKRYSIKKVPPVKPIAYFEYRKFYYPGRIILNAEESKPRKGKRIKKYIWMQDKNNPQKVCQCKLKGRTPAFYLSNAGKYKFTLIVDDGIRSEPFSGEFEVTHLYSLKIRGIFQSPRDKESYLKYKGNGIYYKIFKSPKSGKFKIEIYEKGSKKITEIKTRLRKNKSYYLTFNMKNKECTIEKKNFAIFKFNPFQDKRVRGIKIRTVSVAGNFNNWNPDGDYLERQPDGTYLLCMPLDEGKYYYKFVINGDKWLNDINAPRELEVPDGYGGVNSCIIVGERGEEYGKAVDEGLNIDAIEHDPDDMKYFNPLGESVIEIKIRTIENDADYATIVFKDKSRKIHRVELSSVDTKMGFDYYKGVIHITPGTKVLKYYFVLEEGDKKFYIGEEYISRKEPEERKWYKTAIKVRFSTPDWAKGIVWYQIMLDRFYNGDKGNDPDCTIPWRWNWFKKYPCEKWDDKRFNDPKYGFYGWWGVWNRFYGGDLQGLIKKLKYLKELGVGGIYLNPVFESPSYHKYDTANYIHIDDNFGYKGDIEKVHENYEDPKTWKFTKTDRLFLKFLKKAKNMGIRVIIDGVFNHSGDHFWAFLDVKKKKEKSKYKDWYIISSFNPFRYEGWGGFGGLPVYRENEEGLVPGIREHIFAITKRWMDPNNDGDPSDGIDGWRLDVPNEVNHRFWIKWRKLVKSINPQAYITGEIWENASFWLKGKHFDAVMNYEFAKAVYKFFVNTKKPYKITASEFDKEIHNLLNSYPLQATMVMQNLLDSHDTDRIASGIKNPNRYFDAKNRIQDKDGKGYDMSPPGQKEWKILKLIQIFQFTYIGSPMIYYGDEVGMWGADDPNNRMPMWWKELMPYDNSEYKINYDILNHVKKLAKIRNNSEALKTGLYDTLYVNDTKEIYAFARTSEYERAYIILNNSWKTQSVKIDMPIDEGILRDVLNDKTVNVNNGILSVKIKPKWGMILIERQ